MEFLRAEKLKIIIDEKCLILGSLEHYNSPTEQYFRYLYLSESHFKVIIINILLIFVLLS